MNYMYFSFLLLFCFMVVGVICIRQSNRIWHLEDERQCLQQEIAEMRNARGVRNRPGRKAGIIAAARHV